MGNNGQKANQLRNPYQNLPIYNQPNQYTPPEIVEHVAMVAVVVVGETNGSQTTV